MIATAHLYTAIEIPRRRAWRKLVSAANGCSNFLMAIYKGMWLGALDRAQMAEITQLYYEHASSAADRWDERAYQEAGLFGWERDFVERLTPGGRVLVACAGAGREAFALARKGYVVTAFDCAPALVAAGRRYVGEHELSVRYELSVPDDAPHLGSFDAAIVGWGGYGHIVGRDRRVAFLEALRAQLSQNAPILVSFTARPVSSRRFKVAAAVANCVRRLRRHDPIELGDDLTRPGPFAHSFTRDEVIAEIEEAGFTFDWFGTKDANDVKDGYAIALATPNG